jgi:hypothetical protein
VAPACTIERHSLTKKLASLISTACGLADLPPFFADLLTASLEPLLCRPVLMAGMLPLRCDSYVARAHLRDRLLAFLECRLFSYRSCDVIERGHFLLNFTANFAIRRVGRFVGFFSGFLNVVVSFGILGSLGIFFISTVTSS